MELRLRHLLSVAALLVAGAGASDGRPAIRQFPLDERTVYEIPISPDAPTTLMFPSALTAIEAANVSTDPTIPAPVLLAYSPGRYFFSVRALQPDARAAVNVVWKNRTFVLQFAASTRPCGSVTLY